MNDAGAAPRGSSEAKVVYILYLVGIAAGITGVIGVVMAYVNQGSGPDWLETHHRYQIRTFWIGALYLALGTLLTIFLVGFLVILFWMVWLIARCVKGLKALDAQQPVEDVESWLF